MKYWTDKLRRLTPYSPGEQTQEQNIVKLNTNENPYAPSRKVVAAIRDYPIHSLRLYPDPESTALRQALAEYHHLQPEQVFVGNGSDEVLAHSFHAFFAQPKAILFPDISYSFYPVYCALYNITYTRIPLDAQLQINCADFQRANGGIILTNPNAPTGIALSIEQIRLIVENSPAMIIIDEAYVDFGAESAVPLIRDYDNLLVIRTFSKSRSLAGLRIGYALGHPQQIEALGQIKNSFNSYPIDGVTSAAAIASIADQPYFESCNARIIASRSQLSAGLQNLGFQVYPSSCNFVFVEHCTKPAHALYKALKCKGILVRHFNSPRIDNCLRITIGTEQECRQLLTALEAILAGSYSVQG